MRAASAKQSPTPARARAAGPGTQCDGEDWLAISLMPVFDYSTVHVYERHLELRPAPTEQPGGGDWPNWLFCGFDCYIEWCAAAARALGRGGGRLWGGRPVQAGRCFRWAHASGCVPTPTSRARGRILCASPPP